MFIRLVVVTGSSARGTDNIDVTEPCRETVRNVRTPDDDNPSNLMRIGCRLEHGANLLKRTRRVATEGDDSAIHTVTLGEFLRDRNRICIGDVYGAMYPGGLLQCLSVAAT